jgi:4-amino-4-deoxy-L-arabinose transferase-like glycosyltransferase
MKKRSLLPLIIIFSIALWIPGYLRRDFWQPDEARYAYVAKEMRAGSHWFVPHRHGETYAHKPPLMFWLINAGSVVTGGEIGKIATRLPSLLGVIMTLWAASSIAGLWGDRRAALRTVFITATTFAVWWRAGWGQIDMLLCGLEMMALYLLFADDVRHTLRRPILAFIFFGLGIIAKGPVGFIVPLGAYITANIAAGTKHNLKRRHWLWCLPLTLLLPGLWLLAAKLSGAPDAYFHELIFDQNAGRAVGGQGHIQPFYYYFEYMLADGLPWILFLPPAILVMLRKGKEVPAADGSNQFSDRQKVLSALGWFGFVIIAFSLLPTKRSLYILMAYPAPAIIVGFAWKRLPELPHRALAVSSGLVIAVVAAAGIAFLMIPHFLPDIPLKPAVITPFSMVMIIGAASLFFNYRRFGGPSLQWMYQLIGLFIVIYVMIAVAILPEFNAMKTPRELIPVVEKYLPEGRPLLLYQINAEIMPYYCNRPGRVYWGDTDFWRGIKLYEEGVAVFLASVWEQKKATFGWLGETGTFEMGHKQYVWFAYKITDEVYK